MKFNKNDRVMLISHRHGCDELNPVKFSRYECEGTIVDAQEPHYKPNCIKVIWDNGRTNVYSLEDLQLSARTTWTTLRCKSIW